MDLEAAEAGPAAGVCDKVADGSADGRCDGLRVHEGDCRTGFEECFLLVGVFFVVGGFVGNGNSGYGGLDHAEGYDDLVKHVGELTISY